MNLGLEMNGLRNYLCHRPNSIHENPSGPIHTRKDVFFFNFLFYDSHVDFLAIATIRNREETGNARTINCLGQVRDLDKSFGGVRLGEVCVPLSFRYLTF